MERFCCKRTVQLTPSQSKALSTERHLAITANAGSGKTRVLVTRYVDLFEKFAELTPRNVLTITFTENAAAELRTRITAEITERLASIERSDRGRRTRLLTLRDALPGAYISTIHTFASRILRAYPVEANIDASFAIVDAADEAVLLEDTIRSVFYSALEEAYDSKEETPTLHLFRTLGRHTVGELVRTLLKNRSRTAAVRRNLLSKTDDEIITDWRAQFGTVLQYPQAEETRTLITDLLPFCKKGVKGSDAKDAGNKYFASKTFFERCGDFREFASKMIIAKGDRFSSHVLNEEDLPSAIKQSSTDFIGAYAQLKPLLESSPDSEQAFVEEHREYLFLQRAIFALYDQVLSEYSSLKAEYSLLDFEDLIEKLRSLLEEPRIRTELREQFRFIMIDEYQDTDDDQFAIAKLLTENLGRWNNLTIVGDPKQTIYTFRNADAAVFRETADAIRNQHLSDGALKESVTLNMNEVEERGEIALAETFRMAPQPVAAINRLFRIVMQPHESIVAAEEVTYSDLIHARVGDQQGSVEWICPVKASSEEEEVEEEADETELIAKKIKWIVGGASKEYHIGAEEARPASYEDIAILLRSRTSLERVERALRVENIPYVVAKGVGFYSQQEIVDITSYLTFLVSPHDDIAFAATLRSPFFVVSDVELFQIAHHRSERRRDRKDPWSLWEQFVSYAEEHNEPHLKRALEQLQANLTLTGRTSSALMVEKIYAETGLYATLKDSTNGDQKIANLEKFLSQARESDRSGFSGLFDFVDRVRYLTDSEEQESQADLGDVRGAVRVMTVHAAKGLEFPIVIVPFLQRKFNFSSRGTLDKELGLYIPAGEEDRPPLISELIKLRSRANVISEEKRIFYVAATRARDHLILSSTIGKNPPSDSWLSWTCEAFGMPAGESLQFPEQILRYDQETRITAPQQIELQIQITQSAESIPEPVSAPISSKGVEELPLHLEPLLVVQPTSRFSATQFLRYKECPTKYHLQYVLGLPEEPKLAVDEEPEDYSERVQGQLLGQVVHKLLDKLNGFVLGNTVDTEQFSREFENICFALRVYDDQQKKALSIEALKHVKNFLKSEFAKEALTSSNTRTEYALQVPLASGDILYGIIDRLFLDKDGVWNVLDYKTEAVHDKAKSIERYAFQLQLYAYLVRRLYPEADKVQATLFFTATGTKHDFVFDTLSFEDFESTVKTMIDSIRANEIVKDLALLSQNLAHCPRCPFYAGEQCIVSSLESNRYTGQVAELA
jgi:ATP-dependent helicase/nuclease subunit A